MPLRLRLHLATHVRPSSRATLGRDDLPIPRAPGPVHPRSRARAELELHHRVRLLPSPYDAMSSPPDLVAPPSAAIVATHRRGTPRGRASNTSTTPAVGATPSLRPPPSQRGHLRSAPSADSPHRDGDYASRATLTSKLPRRSSSTVGASRGAPPRSRSHNREAVLHQASHCGTMRPSPCFAPSKHASTSSPCRRSPESATSFSMAGPSRAATP
jgi:hypothetical protein